MITLLFIIFCLIQYNILEPLKEKKGKQYSKDLNKIKVIRLRETTMNLSV